MVIDRLAISVMLRRACATVVGDGTKAPRGRSLWVRWGGARDRSIPTPSHFHPNAALGDPKNAQRLGTAVTAQAGL